MDRADRHLACLAVLGMTSHIDQTTADAAAIYAHMAAATADTLRLVDLIERLRMSRPRVHAAMSMLVRDRTVARLDSGMRYGLDRKSVV